MMKTIVRMMQNMDAVDFLKPVTSCRCVQLLKRCLRGKVMVFGESMGGMTALQITCDFPERGMKLDLQ